MSWWTWIAGGGALAAAGVVLYAFGLGGVLTAVRAVLGAVGDAFAEAREWLRRPGNKAKAFSTLLVLIAAAAGWTAQGLAMGRHLDQVRAAAALDKANYDSRIVGLLSDLSERDQRLARAAELAELERAAVARSKAEADQALAAAATAVARAKKAEQRYQDAFAARPPKCEAALQALAHACPTLEGY